MDKSLLFNLGSILVARISIEINKVFYIFVYHDMQIYAK